MRQLAYILVFLLISFKTVDDLETEKYLNFLAAINHKSTFSYFTVINVKNLNTGLTKEICTKGNFVAGALSMEGYSKFGDSLSKNKSRYFEFKNKQALENISFFEYNSKLVADLRNLYDFDKMASLIKKQKTYSIRLQEDTMKAVAHILFNKGIMTGESNCFGGTLQYVDRNVQKY